MNSSVALDSFFNHLSEKEEREVFVFVEDDIEMSDSTDQPSIQNFFEWNIERNQKVMAKITESYPTRKKNKPEFEPIGEGILPVYKTIIKKDGLNFLEESPHISAIIPNVKLKTFKPVQSSFAGLSGHEKKVKLTWGLEYLRVKDFWDRKIKGTGIKIGVLDTGVDGNHEALKGKVKDFVLIDNIGNIKKFENNETYDSDRHGTHVCGTIAGGVDRTSGVNIGVAPDSELYVASVLGGSNTLDSLINGLVWAISQGVKIVNMSLGMTMYIPELAILCEKLVNRFNIIPVAAIGNECHGNSSSPGNTDFAVGVGAMDLGVRNAPIIPYFSSGASLVENHSSEPITKPNVVAPGVGVYSCIPPEDRIDNRYYYAMFDGTSMATPHVSGICALLMQEHPQASAKQIIDALYQTAEYHGARSNPPDNRWGVGVIRPQKASDFLKKGTN